MSQLQVTGEAKIRDIQGPVVANSGVITALDGAASQYVRGDGTLADFPTSSGGGSSVSYYLNSSVSQGTIGGVAYRELSKEPIIGAGTDIAISSNGYVANYITDVNDPDVVLIPGGNFNCEFYFSVNNNTGNPFFYAELYKYDGTTFTLLGSSVGVPEYITQGTTIAPYYFAIPVATATLALTDRLAIRIYVNVSGRTITLHTENGHLCQVVTTLSKGMVSLNNLTDQSQFLAVGTSGTDFNIVSSGDTHTFNIPSASATNRGLITTGAQTIAGAKVFDNPITANSGIGFLNGVMPNITSNLYSGIGGNSQGISIITRPVSTNYTNNFYFPSASNSYTFPNATGTIALTSDLSSYVTLATSQTITGAKTFTQNLALDGNGSNAGTLLLKSNSALPTAIGYTSLNTTSNTIYLTTYVSNPKTAAFDLSGITDNTIKIFTLPNTSGTLALTSDLSAYLPLTGGTLTGALNGTTATFSGTVSSIVTSGGTSFRVVNSVNSRAWSLIPSTNGAESDLWLYYGGTGTGTKVSFVNNGNVLIGSTTDSGELLQVNGTSKFTGALSGTSATFSGNVTAQGGYLYGQTINSFVRLDNTIGTQIGYLNYADITFDSDGFRFFTGTGTSGSRTQKLLIASTGAATFSSSVTATAATFSDIITNTTGGYRTSASQGYILRNDANSASLGGFTRRSFWAGSAALDTQIFAETGYGIFLNVNGSVTTGINILSSGNVGIGTSLPTNKLTISNNGNAAIAFRINDTNANASFLSLNVSDSDAAIIAGGTSGIPFDIYTGGSIRMRIRNDGITMIGTTTYNSALKGILINPDGYAFYTVDNNTTSTANIYLNRLNADGKLLIFQKNTTDTGYISTNTYSLPSDLNFKKNISNLELGLNLITKLRAVSYNHKIDDADAALSTGFIAQELEQSLTELGVKENEYYILQHKPNEDENQSQYWLDYTKMIPVLVKAIQEQQAQIEELKELIKNK